MKDTRFLGIPAILPYLKPYLPQMIIMAALGTLSSLCDALYPLFNRYALNHFVAYKTLSTVTYFIILYILVLVVQVVSNMISAYLIGRVELEIGRDLKNATFNHLQTLSFDYYNTHNTGYIHARVMSDTDRIGTIMTWRMMDFIWYGSYVICVFIVMMAIHLPLALLLVLLLPIAYMITSYFHKRLIRYNREIREMNGRISGHFNEGITGAPQIKSLVIEEFMQDEFEKETEKMRQVSIQGARSSALLTSSVTFLSSVALAIVLERGGLLNRDGLMALGTLSVFMTYAIDMIEPIQFIIEALAATITVQANIERVIDLLETKPLVCDTEEVIRKYGDNFHPNRDNWESMVGDVTFDDVSFHYPDGDELVLDHFHLQVPAGTNVAIVGETGAGKSTLVNLLCRFYEPTAGHVLIDGCDIKERSQLWLHSHIGYVLQTPHLFSGSIRDNCRFSKPDATDEEIWEALKLVSADTIVSRMKEGLDFEVGEAGSGLSTGEKQLISFARAIINDPALLILDEATSSIDTVTEKQIQSAIETVIKGRTSFVIAHRLSTIVNADIILVVDDGRIVEQGSHQELMKQRGTYYQLYMRQYEDFASEMAY